MVSVIRKTEKAYNGFSDVELKKANALAYWQSFMNNRSK
jgi:hypothetical protein